MRSPRPPAPPVDPRSLGALLTYQASQDPARPAITFEGRTVTRAELEAAANRRARALAELGVGQGDFVAIALPNSVEFFETAFAVWKLGAVPAPISSKLPDVELSAILELMNPRLVVGVDPDRAPGRSVLPIGYRPDLALSDAPLPDMTSPHTKAITSGGSTGRPKVIVDQKPGVLEREGSIMCILPGDVVLNPAPLYHAAPFGVTTMALAWGGHVIQMARFDASRVLELIAEHRVQFVYMVPTMMQRVWRLPEVERREADLSSVEVVVHIAAPCPAWLKSCWISWIGPERLWEFYAGAEGLGATAISGVEWLKHQGSVGRPTAAADLRILDDEGRDCLPGQVGEIYFLPKTGGGSTYQYLGSTGKRRGDWETFGDLGHLDEDGYLYLSDRRADLILCGGANVYPAEIEAALDAHPAVLSSAVVGIPHEDLGQAPYAFVELSPGSHVTEAELLTFLKQRLVSYKLPRGASFVAEPLRDDAGKVRRSALAARYLTGAGQA